MNTCGTCKHYCAEIEGGVYGRTFNEETHLYEARPGYGQCGRIINGEPDEGELATLTDGSGYFAAIICTKDFGCILHEPKIDKAQ